MLRKKGYQKRVDSLPPSALLVWFMLHTSVGADSETLRVTLLLLCSKWSNNMISDHQATTSAAKSTTLTSYFQQD